jgi:DNA-binding MurR/RpiR family transcriptional regulator
MPANQRARPLDPADSFEQLQGVIAANYQGLSRRLRQLAEYALAHPDDMALETIAVIAARAEVPPSSLIRFAKALGYEGFTDMQRLFRERLLERRPSYGERIKVLRARHEGAGVAAAAEMLDKFARAAAAALEQVPENLPAQLLDQATEVLASAEVIHVVGQRRAFPVAAYLSYLLSQLERRSQLLDSVGGMLVQQARAIRAADVLLAVSYRPYAPEVVELVERCHAHGTPVIAITDSPLSPLIRHARVSLSVTEAEVESFRSLSASMCLALTLVVALGERLDAGPLASGRG